MTAQTLIRRRTTPMPTQRRPITAHTPVPDADTPGVCRCGLPMGTMNLRHRPDPDVLAELDLEARLAQNAARARYGDRD